MSFEKYKKIIFIMLFIAIILISGYLLYRVFFKDLLNTSYPKAQISTTTTDNAGLPIAGKNTLNQGKETTEPGQLSPLTNTPRPIANEIARGGVTQTTILGSMPAYSATLSADGKDVQYYNPDDGKFYKIDGNGQAKSLSDKIFNNVEKATWSPDKNQAILEFPDDSNIIYNFATSKQITLPKHWEDFNFSAAGDKIVFKSLGLDPDNRWLAIINSDGTKSTPIEPIGENADNVYPEWSPNNQIAAMYTEGIDFNRQEVYFLGLNGENFKSTVIEGRDFRPKWAPGGNRLLYSVYSSENNMKPMLWIVDANGESIGDNRKSLKLETWSDKCTFQSSTELYCAVPEQLQEGAGLFPEIAKTTDDYLYKIDLTTGAKKLLAIPEQNYNISDLMITEDGKNLYFTDSRTKNLHKIKLK
jgi:Tol biopolymer transport system component